MTGVADQGSNGMPLGPWLAVLGMHRSGTSAVTGAIGALGFQTPSEDDRMDWPESNAEHWESLAMTVFDEDLLAEMGGSWDVPPDLEHRWEEHVGQGGQPSAASVASIAFPRPGPLVWKDPRVCLLLPYWQRRLPKPLAAVLVWRSPLAVARSLYRRDGLPLAYGIALWERYNRAALEHLVGVDTYVFHYESATSDPTAAIGSLADWLASLPQFSGHADRWDRKAAAATIVAEPHASRGRDGDDGLLLPGQQELMTRLAAMEGGALAIGATSLMSESGWVTALLTARRQSHTRELEGLRSQLRERQIELDRLRSSGSWRITEPLRVLSALARTARSRAR